MKTQRNSNIELLRILSMYMIVCYHIFCHCVSGQLDKSVLFKQPLFFKKLLVLATMAPLGKIGNIVFILISGYFMVSKGKNIDLIKVTKKLIGQQLFATILITVGSTITFRVFRDRYIGLINFNFFNGIAWFIGYYFVIIVFAALFFNDFLEKLDKQKYLTFLFVVFGITQFSWANSAFGGLSSGWDLLPIGIFAYALGGYIKKYNPFENIKVIVPIGLIIMSFMLVYISTYNITMQKIQDFERMQPGEVFIQSIPSYADYSLVCVVVAVSLFEIFRRIDIGCSRLINYMGTSTLMIYLLHDNRFVYSIWDTQDWITPLYETPWIFVGKYLLWALGTFTCGVIVFFVYDKLSTLIFRKASGIMVP